MRLGTNASASSHNYVLARGEIGATTDSPYVLKIGDGVTAWNSLPSFTSGGGSLTQEQIEDYVGAMVSGNTETRIAVTYDDSGGKLNAVVDPLPVVIPFSLDGTLTAAAGTKRFYNPTGRTVTLKRVQVHVGTAPTGAAILVDVNINGTTVFTTQGNRPSVAISGNVSSTASAAGQPDAAAAGWDDGEYITVDVDQIGSTIAGADLTGVIYGEV